MIVFSGLDGAGKSTQIELLKNYLFNNNETVLVFWSRGGYTPGMEWLKNLFRKSKSSIISQEKGINDARAKSFSKPYIRKLWLSLAIIDLIFYYSIYIRVKELFGTKVICDRYLFDTIIDFQLNFPQENVERWWLWKILEYLAIKPKKHFILTIPIEESLKRSKLKNEPFPDSKITLEARLERYLLFASQNSNTIHIKGTQSIEEINSTILNEVNK